MSFSDRALRAVEHFSLRNFTIALGAATLLAALAAALSLRAPEEYQASSVLIIDNPLALALAGDDGAILKLDRLRGKYATLAGTQVIAGPVAEQVGLPPGAVIGLTDVLPAPSTLSLVVVGRGPDAETAIELTTAVSDELIRFVEDEHVANNIPEANRFELKVAQPPAGAAKISPSTSRARNSALIVFGLTAVIGYLVLQFVRPPLRPDETVDDRARVGAGPPPP